MSEEIFLKKIVKNYYTSLPPSPCFSKKTHFYMKNRILWGSHSCLCTVLSGFFIRDDDFVLFWVSMFVFSRFQDHLRGREEEVSCFRCKNQIKSNLQKDAQKRNHLHASFCMHRKNLFLPILSDLKPQNYTQL